MWLWPTQNQFPAHSLPDNSRRYFHCFFEDNIGPYTPVRFLRYSMVELTCSAPKLCALEVFNWVIASCPQGMVCLLSTFSHATTSELSNQFTAPLHETQQPSRIKSHLWDVTHFQLCCLNLSFTIKTKSLVKLIPEVAARNLLPWVFVGSFCVSLALVFRPQTGVLSKQGHGKSLIQEQSA